MSALINILLVMDMQGGEIFGMGFAMIGLGTIAFLYLMHVVESILKRLIYISKLLEIIGRFYGLNDRDIHFLEATILKGQEEKEYHKENSPGTPND